MESALCHDEVTQMCGIFAYFGSEHPQELLANAFAEVRPRGPDYSTLRPLDGRSWLGFHRLAIMDPTPAGNQPFELDGASLVCNGEIYNHEALAERYRFPLRTGSDCEVILHMYRRFGIQRTVAELDGVFAFVIVDGDRAFVARDPIGIRGLFMGQRVAGDGRQEWAVASEMKGIHPLMDTVHPFPPGHYACLSLDRPVLNPVPFYHYDYPALEGVDEAAAMAGLRQRLVAAVDKRMMSDRPLGCLVSGGVDSSLVAALVARHFPRGTLQTFTVGLRSGATDRGFARMVADHIGSVHHEVLLTREEALALIADTVRVCESFDTTTIRASTMQLAIARYIRDETDIKVVFNGDVIDEASGSYVYFKNAPSEQAYQDESVRLMRELHLFDVLRTDRTISSAGLEARLPFGDLDFLRFYMAIPPALRRPRDGVEKYLLRKAFDGVLPPEVLWRPKEAFSDGCSNPEESWYSIIQNFAESQVSDAEFAAAQHLHCPPQTKEQLYYRRLFEGFYPERSNVIPHFWMPRWCGEDVIDPSARVLTDVYRPAKASEPQGEHTATETAPVPPVPFEETA